MKTKERNEAVKIAVTGATGQLGRLVISYLLKSIPAAEIIAAVRNVEKASDLAAGGIEVRQADYDAPETWPSALQGVEKVLLISSSEVGRRAKQHEAVIEGAAKAGVRQLVYTSILHADTSPLSLASEHRETETMIRESGIPYVFLRNGWYTENYTAGIPVTLGIGSLFGCAGEGKLSSATRADFAEAAATVLCAQTPDKEIYELAGDDSFTLADFAKEISRQSNKQIPYVNLSEEAYKQVLLKAGLPEPFAAMIADSETGASKGALFDEKRILSRLIGRATTPLAKAVEEALSK